jgi:hypothetical protein
MIFTHKLYILYEWESDMLGVSNNIKGVSIILDAH